MFADWRKNRTFVTVMKRKIATIFKVDAVMAVAFVAMAVTGIKTHVEFPMGNWHSWMTAHTYLSLLFLAVAVWHVWQHRGWYKSLLRRNRSARRHPTVILSLVALAVTVAGLLLWAGVTGENWWMGHFHWIAGLVMIVFGVAHVARRGKRLYKGLLAK